jgi:hypothetical protein
MALKPNRIELPDGSRIKYFMTEEAERGGIVIYGPTSGEGMDDPDAIVSLPGSGTGSPAGVLMNDVVDLDLTRMHINQHKDEVQVGNKVDIIVRGVIQTNMLVEGDTPSAGDDAHYAAGGLFTTDTDSVKVGKFASGVDADGYVEIEVNVN